MMMVMMMMSTTTTMTMMMMIVMTAGNVIWQTMMQGIRPCHHGRSCIHHGVMNIQIGIGHLEASHFNGDYDNELDIIIIYDKQPRIP